MRTTILLCIYILFVTVSYASKTVIKGNAKLFSGKEITLIAYKDYFSNLKEPIGYTTVSNDGTYSYSFNIEKIEKVILKIEDKTTWFFAVPGKVYNINLSYNKELNKGRVYDKELSLLFNFPVPTELNQQIKKFNKSFDNFIDENIVLFKKRDRSIEPKLKAYKTKVLKEVENGNTFVKEYIAYSIGSTQNALDVSFTAKLAEKGTNTKANLYLEYLEKKPILYFNPEYTKFFKDFFKGELKDLTLQLNGMDITAAINDKSSYADLSKALSKYPFLQDDEFKNLFILNGLREISKDKYFTKKNIITILNEIKANSKYPHQKEIASNIIEKITRKKFGVGSKAPLFALKNRKNEQVSLSEFKGKPVYINFWTNWSIPSQKEMKIMKMLHKKYKNKVHFISICCDNDFNKMTSFLSKNDNYNWDFLHIGDDKKMLEKYSVATYPTYILLDQKLIVYKFPAGRPGGTAERATEDNIEKDFYTLTK